MDLEKLLNIVKLADCEVSLNFNPNKANYESIEDYFEWKELIINDHHPDSDIPEEIYNEIVSSENLIELIIYPNTPITSVTFFHYDLSEIIKEGLKYMKGNKK